MKRLNYMELSPKASQAMLALSKEVHALPLDKNMVDLVQIRASQLNGCLFCLDMHSKEAHLHDERPLRLYHLPAWRESSLFTEKERAALEWTELLTRPGVHGVTDEDYQKAREQFSEKELADLTFAVTTINAWNRLGVAFRATPGSMDQMMGLDRAGLK